MGNEKNSGIPTISKLVDDGKMYFAKCEHNGTGKIVKTDENRENDNSVNANGAEDGKTENEKKTKRFSFKQKVALVMLASADFMSYFSMSIMAPFYPKIAAQKGMSESMAGFVFGYYAMVIFIASPIFGKVLPRVGAKFLFISGILLLGICNIIFGSLDTIQEYHLFTTLSFVIRGLEALGASAFSTAAYVMVMNIFPDNAGAVRGLLETFVGLGLSAGPGIGGILFAFGGFGLPFYSVGTIIVLMAPMNIFFLPSAKNWDTGTRSGSLISLLRLSPVMVTCAMMVVTSMTWGFLDPTLEPHLRKFQLSPSNVGLIFLLLSATYGLFCPAWGWLSDKVEDYCWLMTTGLFGSSFVLLLLGPSPILYFIKDSIWLNIVSLSGLGVFVAMSLMPTYQFILDSAVEGGFSDNLGTHAVIAGLWSSVYSLGEVLGPILGGTLMEQFDFPVAATTFSGFNFVLAIVGTTFFVYQKKNRKDVGPTKFLVSLKPEEVKKEYYNHDIPGLTLDNIVKNDLRTDTSKINKDYYKNIPELDLKSTVKSDIRTERVKTK